MKKILVLGVAAFYLLLTTGMFVCILHCTADFLTKSTTMEMKGMACHPLGKKGKSSNSCDCCKGHGQYVIQENINPGSNYVVLSVVGIIPNQPSSFLFSNGVPSIGTYYFDHKPPPGLYAYGRFIQFHSLQI